MVYVNDYKHSAWNEIKSAAVGCGCHTVVCSVNSDNGVIFFLNLVVYFKSILLISYCQLLISASESSLIMMMDLTNVW